MVVAVGVAAGAVQRTLAGDFDRQRWRVAGQDPAPRAEESNPSLHYNARAMKRRTLLQWLGGVARLRRRTVPLRSIRLFAQPRELTPEAVADAA